MRGEGYNTCGACVGVGVTPRLAQHRREGRLLCLLLRILFQIGLRLSEGLSRRTLDAGVNRVLLRQQHTALVALGVTLGLLLDNVARLQKVLQESL